MRSIAYVTTTFPTLATFIENEVHRLRARGVDVRVFTLRGVGREYQPEHEPLLAITETLGSPLSPLGWLAVAGWLLRRPHVLVPDLVRVLWSSRSSPYALLGHVAYLPAAARLASRLERDDIERVHGAWAHFPGTVAYLASRLARRRFTLAAHAGADLFRTRAFLAEKVRAAEFTAACVRGNAEMLRGLAGPGARVEWLYHGVDLERFDGRGRRRDPVPLVLCVGRLAVVKGFDLAIDALAAMRSRGLDARLCLVGDGPERARLEAQASARGVADAVTFAGALSHEPLRAWYRRAWVLAAPSRVMPNGRRDGIPNVIVEALAMGVPCVGTRAAGLEEAIVPGETGALCDPGDAAGLAAALESLLRDPERLDAMAPVARRRALETFDQARNFERLWELYGGPPPARAERSA